MWESLCVLGLFLAPVCGCDWPDASADEVHRTPILPPIATGQRTVCENPPSLHEILRALPNGRSDISSVVTESLDNVEFTVEKLVDRIDPPRFFPLIGPAQLHHCHWKCTVHFNETVDVIYPVAVNIKRQRTQVVYIDKDCLHLCAAGQEGGALPRPLPTVITPALLERKISPVETQERTHALAQIQLDVQVFAVDRAALAATPLPWPAEQPGEGDTKMRFSVLANDEKLVTELQALRKSGAAKLLAAPRIVTLNGKKATFANGSEVAIRTETGVGEPIVTYKQVGTTASILPLLRTSSRVVLEVEIESCQADPAASIAVPTPPTSVPGFATSVASVTAHVDVGKTLAIGGLTTNEMWAVKGTSILGNFGRFSRDLAVSTTERELVVLITPRLVDPAIGSAVSIADVVLMSNAGVSSNIILRQMELTNSAYDLTVSDIVFLRRAGVSNRIISAMQECSPILRSLTLPARHAPVADGSGSPSSGR